MVFSMTCDIVFPAVFNIHFMSFKFMHIVTRFYTILYFNSHILPLPSLTHFTFFFPLVLHFIFSLATSCSYSALLLFLPIQPLKTNFLVNGHLTFLLPLFKYPCSLSTFSNLSLLVVDRVGFIAIFQFYLYIFTNFIVQISNFTIPFSYSSVSNFNFALSLYFFFFSLSSSFSFLFVSNFKFSLF